MDTLALLALAAKYDPSLLAKLAAAIPTQQTPANGGRN